MFRPKYGLEDRRCAEASGFYFLCESSIGRKGDLSLIHKKSRI